MLNILLMDQDCNHLTFLRKLFESFPCQLSVVYSAPQFLDVIKKNQIDLIIGNFFISDILWERIDGQAWCFTQQERVCVSACLIYYNPAELSFSMSPLLQAIQVADWVLPSSDTIQTLQQKIKHIIGANQAASDQTHLEDKLNTLAIEYYSLHQILKKVLEVGKLNVWEWHLDTHKVNDVGFRQSISHPNGYLNPDMSLDWFMQLVHPDDKKVVEEKIAQTTTEGMAFNCDFRVDLTGQMEWIRSVGHFVEDSRYQWKKCIGIWEAISEQKNNELLVDQQKNALHQIQHINSLGEVTATLIHQLAQPLHIMKSYVTGCIYRIKMNNFDHQEMLTVLQSTSSYIDLTAEMIQSFKKLIHNKEVTFEVCDVNEIIQFTFEAMSVQMRAVRIHFDLDETLPLIEVNRMQLVQVIMNIIKNALDVFQEHRTKDPMISIKTSRADHHALQIVIEDNGPGMAEEILENLFIPCFTTKKNGMGMGLKICQQIIQAHGGRISVHSRSGQGARFHFTLPVILD